MLLRKSTRSFLLYASECLNAPAWRNSKYVDGHLLTIDLSPYALTKRSIALEN